MMWHGEDAPLTPPVSAAESFYPMAGTEEEEDIDGFADIIRALSGDDKMGAADAAAPVAIESYDMLNPDQYSMVDDEVKDGVYELPVAVPPGNNPGKVSGASSIDEIRARLTFFNELDGSTGACPSLTLTDTDGPTDNPAYQLAGTLTLASSNDGPSGEATYELAGAKSKLQQESSSDGPTGESTYELAGANARSRQESSTDGPTGESTYELAGANARVQQEATYMMAAGARAGLQKEAIYDMGSKSASRPISTRQPDEATYEMAATSAGLRKEAIYDMGSKSASRPVFLPASRQTTDEDTYEMGGTGASRPRTMFSLARSDEATYALAGTEFGSSTDDAVCEPGAGGAGASRPKTMWTLPPSDEDTYALAGTDRPDNAVYDIGGIGHAKASGIEDEIEDDADTSAWKNTAPILRTKETPARARPLSISATASSDEIRAHFKMGLHNKKNKKLPVLNLLEEDENTESVYKLAGEEVTDTDADLDVLKPKRTDDQHETYMDHKADEATQFLLSLSANVTPYPSETPEPEPAINDLYDTSTLVGYISENPEPEPAISDLYDTSTLVGYTSDANEAFGVMLQKQTPVFAGGEDVSVYKLASTDEEAGEEATDTGVDPDGYEILGLTEATASMHGYMHGYGEDILGTTSSTRFAAEALKPKRTGKEQETYMVHKAQEATDFLLAMAAGSHRRPSLKEVDPHSVVNEPEFNQHYDMRSMSALGPNSRCASYDDALDQVSESPRDTSAYLQSARCHVASAHLQSARCHVACATHMLPGFDDFCIL